MRAATIFWLDIVVLLIGVAFLYLQRERWQRPR